MKLSVRKTFFLSAIGFLALGFVLLKNSGESIQKSQESSSLQSIKTSDGSSKGRVFGESIGLPPTWPNDFIIENGATVISSSYNSSSGQVSFQIDKDIDALTNYYKENLSNLGWVDLGNHKYTKGNIDVNLEFTKMGNNKSIVIVSYSLVPTK